METDKLLHFGRKWAFRGLIGIRKGRRYCRLPCRRIHTAVFTQINWSYSH